MLYKLLRMCVRESIAKSLRGYRSPTRPLKYLSPQAVATESMVLDKQQQARPQGNLYKIWQQIPGGHKWWHYFDVYERLLEPLRTKPIRFLEIGVYRGGSLAMWRRYFHPETIIVGLDINQTCKRFEAAAENVHVRIGDQSDTNFLQSVFDEFGPFDVIIDDGSHICSHMIDTFVHAFLNGLTDKGIYLIEDTHTNFWLSHRDQRYSFVDFCKDLVDLSHAHYTGKLSSSAFAIGNPNRLQAVNMTSIGAQIEEIRFFDSIVVFQRWKGRPLPTVEHL